MSHLLRRRNLAAAAIIAVLAGTGGWLYMRNNASASTQYRLATATLGTVTQTIALSGNLTPVGETDLDFGAAGRVQTVSVQVGQAVKSGDVLAALDTTSLQGALTQAQANLQSAQARLSLDRAGPTAQSLAQSQASVNSAQVGLQNAQTSLTDTQALNQQSITQAQSAVAAAQNTVNADQAVLNADTAKQQSDKNQQSTDCASSPPTQQCQQDNQQVATDNQKVASDQQTLTRDQGSLDSAQNALTSAQAKAQQSLDQAQGQVNSAQVQLQNAQAALAALQQGTTSQQIQMDQSQVSIAQVNVDTAQRSLNQATLTAPVDGAVAQVNITTGQTVTSGNASSSASSSSSTTHAIVILTPGAFAVTGTVSDAQINQLAIGQRARVIAAGSSQGVTGKVTAVAAQATVSSGVATFAVTVTLDQANPSLHAGMSASVAVIVNQVVQVLTVPTSAVSNGTVQVMVNGQPQTRSVVTGASDALRTQITSGLNEGDTVVLATVSGTVPTTTGNGGGGLFGGGGVRVGGGGGGGRGAGG